MNAAKKSFTGKAASSQSSGTGRGRSLARVSRKTPATRSRKSSSRVRRANKSDTKGALPPKLRAKVPAILLQGDTPTTPSPLRRSASSKPGVSPTQAPASGGSLPSAYGTRGLKLTPRDPHWLNAHWDFTRQQLRDANRQSADGHLVLRTFKESGRGPLISETHVHPESSRWMVHVPHSGMPYAAEIGFYDDQRAWSPLAASNIVSTPPAGASADQGFELATMRADGTVQRHGSSSHPQPPHLPGAGGFPGRAGLDPGGSLGLAEGFPGSWVAAPSSMALSSWSSPGVSSRWSSPREEASPPSFQLTVNAELIIHGTTEPDATLQVGDQIIPLTGEGTFRLRFALPDGAQQVSFKAISARTGEQREGQLCFTRQTLTSGAVGATPQTHELKIPGAETL